VVGGLRILAAMQRAGASLMVFSSSAAVYGQPDRDLIDESAPKEPCNPYGRTKLVFEQALADHQGQRPWTPSVAKTYSDEAAAALREAAGSSRRRRPAKHRAAPQQPAPCSAKPATQGEAEGKAETSNQQLQFVALRYFNAAGAHASGQIGEDHPVETHLVPNLLKAALSGGAEPLKVFGTDYPTPDGTAVRDYVHVEDLARAHVLALEYLARGGGSLAANLGTGRGSSIREVLAAARQVTGRDFPAEDAPRRAGDPARLVASNALAKAKLGWEPQRSLQDIIASAWKWHSEHPKGYATRK